MQHCHVLTFDLTLILLVTVKTRSDRAMFFIFPLYENYTAGKDL